MKLNSFDWIAPVYDVLVRIVFGTTIKRAQLTFLSRIPDHSRVLILGGGTGWLLKELLLLKPHCVVTYVEASGKMLSMTKELLSGANNVTFIHGTEKNLPPQTTYDAVITNFYLDLFTPEYAAQVVNQIKNVLAKKGVWILTDFVDNGRWWQRMLLWVMYRFFVLTCAIEAKALIEWQTLMLNCSMKSEAEAEYYRYFIKSVVYRKLEITGS